MMMLLWDRIRMMIQLPLGGGVVHLVIRQQSRGDGGGRGGPIVFASFAADCSLDCSITHPRGRA